jgi:hypothetical protein
MVSTVLPGRHNKRLRRTAKNRNGETETVRRGAKKLRHQRSEVRRQIIQSGEYPLASPEGEADGGQVELQNREPQNDEVVTSIFEIPCSIFCGSNRQQLRYGQFRLFLS